MLIYIVLASYIAIGVLLLIIVVRRIKEKKQLHPLEREVLKRRKEVKSNKKSKMQLETSLFNIYRKLPLFKTYAYRLMARFSQIGEKDQQYLMKKTVLILNSLVIFDFLAVLLFWQMTKNVVYLGIFVFFLWYIAGSFIDFFLAHGYLRLLEQMLTFMSLVRQKYYEYGTIDDAIYETTQMLGEQDREMSMQGELIYEVLISSQSEKMMTQYCETAPNPYLKIFLNFSYMVMEYGDQKVEGHSVFLTNLSFLSKNIQLEIDKRKRLNYALKSMNFIVMLPLAFLSLIKEWAVTNFALLGIFYSSPLGKYIELLTILIMLVSMVLLNKIQHLEREHYRYDGFEKLLRKIPIALTEWKKKKWIYCMCFFFFSMLMIVSINIGAKHKLSTMVYYDSQFMGGSLSEDEIGQRKSESVRDYTFIINSNKETSIEEVREWIGNEEEPEREIRIMTKLKLYHSYYLKYYQVVIALVVGIIGYYLPEMNRYLSKKLIEMDIDDEVAGFRSMIMMLIHQPRMNIEEIITWLDNYAIFYQQPLHRCSLNLTSGEYNALLELSTDTEHEEMKRIVRQLMMASEDISLEEAFDELIQEKANYFEQRKWQNEKLITRKMILGQNIGFLPTYSLIVLYMIIPMVMTSTQELEKFFKQLI